VVARERSTCYTGRMKEEILSAAVSELLIVADGLSKSHFRVAYFLPPSFVSHFSSVRKTARSATRRRGDNRSTGEARRAPLRSASVVAAGKESFSWLWISLEPARETRGGRGGGGANYIAILSSPLDSLLHTIVQFEVHQSKLYLTLLTTSKT
jgi:hypothetical protein